MKSPRMWLFTALVVSGLFSVVQADEFSRVTAQPVSQQEFGAVSAAHSPVVRGRWFRPIENVQAVFRAQSDDGGIPIPPDASETPLTIAPPTSTDPSEITSSPGQPFPGQPIPGQPIPGTTTWNAFSPPMTSDPFMNGGVVQPYAPVFPPGPGYGGLPPATGFSIPGANGGRPYNCGWEQKLDTYLIPGANVSGGGAAGNLDELGVDYSLGLTQPFSPGWLLKKTFLFRSRHWDGPGAVVPPSSVPGSAFRFGGDFEFATPQAGPTSISLGITPSLNTDLNGSTSSDAFQLDGRGIMWWRLDCHWMFGMGAMFWDRVDDRVLPYAGWVYRDDYWEMRLMFPETEIRLFLGNEPWWSKWIYIRSKYNIEAYQGVVTTGGIRDEFEIEDWQLTMGFQMDAGTYRWFVEGGLVLDREFEYDVTPDIAIDTAFISRIGIRY
ncbi:MAG: hypothetical protein MK102_01120 [Fuerstiella sp.]|nr:hypothetical protein [Fuerstiella sp.]